MSNKVSLKPIFSLLYFYAHMTFMPLRNGASIWVRGLSRAQQAQQV